MRDVGLPISIDVNVSDDEPLVDQNPGEGCVVVLGLAWAGGRLRLSAAAALASSSASQRARRYRLPADARRGRSFVVPIMARAHSTAVEALSVPPGT